MHDDEDEKEADAFLTSTASIRMQHSAESSPSQEAMMLTGSPTSSVSSLHTPQLTGGSLISSSQHNTPHQQSTQNWSILCWLLLAFSYYY